ncbi:MULTISPECIES: hypothetical protein [Micromonospora]|uniref:hypothetical protein n=1 Tax=Micromonospora TaxID=1873 RepID=UPI0003EECBDC|nr:MULTISPECIES: hypothetical protein [unclassified Micromonospora]EWM66874.1 hypothetical protein MCBG_04007 [Micromonospora sp. M42]MCK1804823.1 hypothetical protein [Micromonospora sp. R42106]MCK1831158.1 hypothetical protein [Micromonospora sp. R42003]MCK1842263.1 hypothetical protein [Micromonospora sp. R42004]MCM1018263.1 hypothetical protein [Micromonospora sp. XM-20-01]
MRDDDTTVVEWGDAEPESPGRAGRSLAALGRDRRLPTVLAGLATVAAVASLIGEWLIITVPAEARDDDAPTRLTSGISEIGGFGVAYLVGLLGLSVALALALRGAPAVRRHAALAGLGLSAGVLGVLVATAASLEQLARRILFFVGDQRLDVEHGRGLVTAFLAVALLAAALHLAGRSAGDTPADEEPDHDHPDDRHAWRGRAATDDLPPAPADLTVQPTVPFADPDRSR